MLLITHLEIKSTYPKHVTCNIRCATLPVSTMLKAFHSINCWIIQFIFDLHNNHTEFVYNVIIINTPLVKFKGLQASVHLPVLGP